MTTTLPRSSLPPGPVRPASTSTRNTDAATWHIAGGTEVVLGILRTSRRYYTARIGLPAGMIEHIYRASSLRFVLLSGCAGVRRRPKPGAVNRWPIALTEGSTTCVKVAFSEQPSPSVDISQWSLAKHQSLVTMRYSLSHFSQACFAIFLLLSVLLLRHPLLVFRYLTCPNAFLMADSGPRRPVGSMRSAGSGSSGTRL